MPLQKHRFSHTSALICRITPVARVPATALLPQNGEFCFVRAAAGSQAVVIANFGYQMAIAIVAVSLPIGPAWIALAKRVLSGGVRQATT